MQVIVFFVSAALVEEGVEVKIVGTGRGVDEVEGVGVGVCVTFGIGFVGPFNVSLANDL